MPEKFRCLFEASPGFLDLLCLGNVTESHLLVIDWLCHMGFSCKNQEDNPSCTVSAVIYLVIDRAQKWSIMKVNVRGKKFNLMFPKLCEPSHLSRLASFLNLSRKSLENDLGEFELFFELQMQGHHIEGSDSVFILFSFLFSSIILPSDIIRLYRIVVKSLVAVWNLRVFLFVDLLQSSGVKQINKTAIFLSGRSSKDFFQLEPLYYNSASCHFCSFAKGTVPNILKC